MGEVYPLGGVRVNTVDRVEVYSLSRVHFMEYTQENTLSELHSVGGIHSVGGVHLVEYTQWVEYT